MFSNFITWVSIFAVGVGVTIIIIVLAVINGFEKEVTRHTIGIGAHAMIFFSASPSKPWSDTLETLENMPIVKVADPFLRGEGLISFKKTTVPIKIEGIPLDAKDGTLISYLDLKQKDDLNLNEASVFLGEELANHLQTTEGDRLTLVIPKRSNDNSSVYLRAAKVKHAGTFHVGMHEVDGQLLLTDMETARRVLIPRNEISGFRLTYHDNNKTQAKTTEILNKLGPGFEAVNWTQYNRNFFLALKSQKRILFVILSLIVAVATFNIASAILLIVEEKRAEIAILHTIGCGRLSLMFIFLTLSAFVSFSGALLGVLAGYSLTFMLNPTVELVEASFGIRLLDPTIYYISYLPTDVRFTDALFTSITAIVMCLLASAIPAYKASEDPFKHFDN